MAQESSFLQGGIKAMVFTQGQLNVMPNTPEYKLVVKKQLRSGAFTHNLIVELRRFCSFSVFLFCTKGCSLIPGRCFSSFFNNSNSMLFYLVITVIYC